MPFEFLIEDHLARYGRYHGDPTPQQLTRHFYLDAKERALVDKPRHDHTRLGFAVSSAR